MIHGATVGNGVSMYIKHAVSVKVFKQRLKHQLDNILHGLATKIWWHHNLFGTLQWLPYQRGEWNLAMLHTTKGHSRIKLCGACDYTARLATWFIPWQKVNTFDNLHHIYRWGYKNNCESDVWCHCIYLYEIQLNIFKIAFLNWIPRCPWTGDAPILGRDVIKFDYLHYMAKINCESGDGNITTKWLKI